MKKLACLLLGIGLLMSFVGCGNNHDVSGPASSMNGRSASNFAPLQSEGDLGNLVWVDANCNGIQDNDEVGMPGVLVKLYDCQARLIDSMETDDQGNYLFARIRSGNYSLHFDLPAGFSFSPMNQGDSDSLDSDVNPETGNTECTSLDSAEVDLSWDAGLCRQAQEEGCLGDFVWVDANCNGIQDEDEPGMADVTVKLYTCDDSSLVQQVQTGDRGSYFFEGLEAGSYFIHFILPDGYEFSPTNQGDNDGIDSDADSLSGNTACITLEAGACDSTWDAGLCQVEEEVCTRGKGYWKTHGGFGPQDDVVTPLLPIWLGTPDSSKSLNVNTGQIAHDVLVMFTYGRPSNGITKLYAQLLAAKLNVANGADAADIAETIDMADEFLAAYDWTDWSMLNGEQRQMVLSWMETLEDFNEGRIGPGACDDGDVDRGDGGDYDLVK